MCKDITYRQPNTSEVLQLSLLLKQVYLDTYATKGVTESFANYIDKIFSIDTLKEEITGSKVHYITAYHDSNPVGVVKWLEDSTCPINLTRYPEISKLYISRHFIRQGIGKELINQVETRLRTLSKKRLWLWLYHKNENALEFYRRQGFIEIGSASQQIGVNTFKNLVMNKELV